MQNDWIKWLFIAKFANNNNVSAFTNVSLFYANKEFHSHISFNPDIIDYVIIKKRLNIAKTKDIINRMQNVFIYIREKMNKTQLIIIEQINRYKKDMTFKKGDLVFLNTKNIIIDKSSKKLDDKMFDSFKIISVIDSFYKLKLFEIIKIYNVFHSKLLNLVVINLLSKQKNSSFKAIIIKSKKKWIIENILNFKKLRNRLKYKVRWKDVDKNLN